MVRHVQATRTEWNCQIVRVETGAVYTLISTAPHTMLFL